MTCSVVCVAFVSSRCRHDCCRLPGFLRTAAARGTSRCHISLGKKITRCRRALVCRHRNRNRHQHDRDTHRRHSCTSQSTIISHFFSILVNSIIDAMAFRPAKCDMPCVARYYLHRLEHVLGCEMYRTLLERLKSRPIRVATACSGTDAIIVFAETVNGTAPPQPRLNRLLVIGRGPPTYVSYMFAGIGLSLQSSFCVSLRFSIF